MIFEFDQAKSAANKAKHDIDFVEAQSLWKDVAAERSLPYIGEDRSLRIGMVGAKLWVAVFTMRDGRVRLISVRRARLEEEVEYGREVGRQGEHNHEH